MTSTRKRGGLLFAVLGVCGAALALNSERIREMFNGGVERWPVKTGTDQTVSEVNMQPQYTSVEQLIALARPSNLSLSTPNPNYQSVRDGSVERSTFTLNATIVKFKQEADCDIHLVLQGDSGVQMIAEIPDPGAVGATSPFRAAISQVQADFVRAYHPTTSFQNANLHVRLTGVGFWDYQHGQTGAAPNQLELHPVFSLLTDVVAVSGTITLQGCVASAVALQPIVFTFRPVGGGTPFTRTVPLHTDGSFLLDDIPLGRYNVAIKGAKWLQRVVAIDAQSGNVANLNATLLAGDVTNHNMVTTSDYLALKAAFGSTPSSTNWNPGADLNCDGVVSTADYLLLKANFGMVGDL